LLVIFNAHISKKNYLIALVRLKETLHPEISEIGGAEFVIFAVDAWVCQHVPFLSSNTLKTITIVLDKFFANY
jgi:hypothetical protein